MRLGTKVKRTLRAESLESRQLLHGGAMNGGGEPPTSEERATEAVARFDANEDMQLSQDEVSDRLWNRISAADGDENGAVSVDELTAHLDQVAAERAENSSEDGEQDGRQRSDQNDRNRNGGNGGERLSVEERIDSFFAENDTNEDGVITAEDDVSEELLARIVDADVDGDGVSAADLLARHEARVQERFDTRFAALDENGDGGITADEVSERRWERISAADGEDGDGSVTADELQTYLDALRAEREAARDAAAEDAAEEVDEEVDVTSEEAALQVANEAAQRRQAVSTRGRASAGGRR